MDAIARVEMPLQIMMRDYIYEKGWEGTIKTTGISNIDVIAATVVAVSKLVDFEFAGISKPRCHTIRNIGKSLTINFAVLTVFEVTLLDHMVNARTLQFYPDDMKKVSILHPLFPLSSTTLFVSLTLLQVRELIARLKNVALNTDNWQFDYEWYVHFLHPPSLRVFNNDFRC